MYTSLRFGSGSWPASTRYRKAASYSSCQWCSHLWRVSRSRGIPEDSCNSPDSNRLEGVTKRRHGTTSRKYVAYAFARRPSRDAAARRLTYSTHLCFQEMTISLAVPDILVARAKSGDLEALEALYRAFETPVYNVALRILRSPEDAEDVLQETFLEVVRSLKQYRGEGHLWGWIRQIATSKALMRIRHDRVRETEEFHEESAVGVGVVAGAGAAGRSPGAVPAQIDLERAL